MKKVFEKWCSISLVLRIAVGLVIGAILGLLVPQFTIVSWLGTIFVGALRAVAPVLVFVLVMSSLANSKGGAGANMRVVIILYMASTFFAAFLATVASFLFPQTIELAEAATATAAPQGIGEVIENLFVNMVSNPVASIVNGNYIGILTWAVIFGVALKKSSDVTRKLLLDVSEAVSQAVRWVINLAPFGILGLVFDTVSENGLEIFAGYGKLLALLVGCMLFISFVTNPIVAFICMRKNPYPLVFTCLKESGITAFFTRSSAANIPMNMALCKKLGLNEDYYSVSIPLGATINMDGAAITITVMTLAAANTLGVAVDFPSALVLSIVATLAACGASGVAGGSLLLIPLACSLFGISNDVAMQVVAVGFIIGVIQDSVETALNSSSDVLMTASAEYYLRRKAEKK
ncbi:MAG: serine/threonine transporter SstT [Suilimivivens sp.]|nr:serine/threonine transporter SstT [Lachnospiraceae bacterium]MDY5871243.1 serine/threonine transporter SstT [Lachnospiraceae bacterium]